MSSLDDQLATLAKQQQYTLELEKEKWNFKQKELEFLEAGQHMRALNQLMWQIPTMAIAITGGLWYGAANIDADAPRAWVFSFACLVDFLTIGTLLRLREIIGQQIYTQEKLTGSTPRSVFPKYMVVGCWSVALVAAAVIGFVGALKSEVFTKAPNHSAPATVNALQLPQSCFVPQRSSATK